MDKRVWTDSPSKISGGGQLVFKVTFFLSHFSEEFEIFLEEIQSSRIFFGGG